MLYFDTQAKSEIHAFFALGTNILLRFRRGKWDSVRGFVSFGRNWEGKAYCRLTTIELSLFSHLFATVHVLQYSSTATISVNILTSQIVLNMSPWRKTNSWPPKHRADALSSELPGDWWWPARSFTVFFFFRTGWQGRWFWMWNGPSPLSTRSSHKSTTTVYNIYALTVLTEQTWLTT